MFACLSIDLKKSAAIIRQEVVQFMKEHPEMVSIVVHVVITMKMSVTTNEYNANTIDICGWGFASLDRFLAVNAPEN